MYKNIFITLMSLMLLVALTFSASAAKILSVPTADVLDEHLELNFIHQRAINSLSAQVGVYPGISVGLKQEFGSNSRLYATIKAALIRETQDLPGFALGGELSLSKQNIYAVVSKQLGLPGLRGHLALGSGRFSRGMAGVSYMLNPVKVKNIPTTSLFAEYDGQGLNAGVIAQFSPEFGVNLALSSDYGIGFGVNFKTVF